MDKPTIAVIGAGLMGHGIAQVFAAAGHDVSIHDPAADALASVPARARAVFELLGQDPGGAAHINLCAELEAAVQDADFVFEAAPEKPELKQDIFERLGHAAKPATVLATNTSAIPITGIAARAHNPERVVGAHFWNPPYLIPLVEVVQAEKTDPAVVESMIALLTGAGRMPVHVRRDIPGFIGNRLQHALKREAIALVAAGVCDAETIDRVVKHGFGARMAVLGPMEQSDLVGLNLTLDIHRVLIADLDRTPGPHAYLADKVAAGDLGMSTGSGFRDWTPEQASEVRQRLARFLAAAAREGGKNNDK
ncbi:MAG: 3-hydroxyacyl-CoA dehydrogenase family protein [Alphaproteobacteria bacterium]